MIQELIEMGMPFHAAAKAKSNLPKDSVPYSYETITFYHITPTKQRRKREMVEIKYLLNGKENKVIFPTKGSRWSR